MARDDGDDRIHGHGHGDGHGDGYGGGCYFLFDYIIYLLVRSV